MVKLLQDANGLRTFAVVFRNGEDPMAGLEAFARERRVTGAALSAIGAFRRATVGYFDWEKKDYRRVPIDEQVEVLALTGNIALKGSDPALHLHVVLGRRDGTAWGGHLLEATVRPTLEVTVVETPAHLRRRTDPETGLALIDMGE